MAEVPPEVDYGPQPALDTLPKIAEVEPNDEPDQATPIATPGVATGKVAGTTPCAVAIRTAHGVCLLRMRICFASKPRRAISGSSRRKLRGLTRRSIRSLKCWMPRSAGAAAAAAGRARSVIEFRGMNSEQRGVRLANWEEMLLNEYVYLSGDVIKLFQQRRGPDADAQFYPENGNRFAFFETTSRAHTLGEPAYIVVPYAGGHRAAEQRFAGVHAVL